MTHRSRMILGAYSTLMVAGMLANVESPPDSSTVVSLEPWPPRAPRGPFPAWCRTPAARQRWAGKRGAP